MLKQTVLAALAMAVAAAGGCTSVNVTRVDPEKPYEAVGIRYSLPKAFIRAAEDPDTGEITCQVIYLPDEENTYAIDVGGVMDKHTINVTLDDNGLLKKIAYTTDTTVIPAKIGDVVGSVAQTSVKAVNDKRQADAQAMATAKAQRVTDVAALQAKLDAADAALVAADEAVQQAQFDLDQANKALKRKPDDATLSDAVDAKQFALDKAKRAAAAAKKARDDLAHQLKVLKASPIVPGAPVASGGGASSGGTSSGGTSDGGASGGTSSGGGNGSGDGGGSSATASSNGDSNGGNSTSDGDTGNGSNGGTGNTADAGGGGSTTGSTTASAPAPGPSGPLVADTVKGAAQPMLYAVLEGERGGKPAVELRAVRIEGTLAVPKVTSGSIAQPSTFVATLTPVASTIKAGEPLTIRSDKKLTAAADASVVGPNGVATPAQAVLSPSKTEVTVSFSPRLAPGEYTLTLKVVPDVAPRRQETHNDVKFTVKP